MNLFLSRYFLFLLIFLVPVASYAGNNDFEGYKPWGEASGSKSIDPRFTRSYMDSRSPRLVFELNSDWTFLYSPVSYELDSFVRKETDDRKWQIIRLPHTWMTYETTRELHPFIMNASENDDAYWWKGWGYYRKRIEISKSLQNKSLFLEFDGVQKYCKIYMNGIEVCEHMGGFNSFSVDITKFIQWDNKEQIITVAVNGYRRDKWRIPPMTAGNWNLYSGIYRSVRFVAKNKVHIPYQGNYNTEGGTFVTTPWIRHDSARVAVKTFIQNTSDMEQVILLNTKIVNNSGGIMAELNNTKELKSGEQVCIPQQSPILSKIKLWSPDTPVLYKVVSSVYQDGKLIDCYESPLGFRTFQWDYKSNTLIVNGSKINIQGINRHQEYPWLGDAIPTWITLKDMADIRYGLGDNFMRTAHYPQDPIVYDFNNQSGIITVEEVPNIKNISFNDRVQEQNVRSMIRRDRNNPSVFFWSVGNETSDAADSRWVVEEDTTRIIHARKAEGAGDFVQHTHENLDMENLLRVTHRGWFCNDDQQNGSRLNPIDGQLAGSNEWEYERAKMVNGSVRGDLNHNCVAWLYQDHGADRKYSGSTLNSVNAKGWVDMYRIPKYIYQLTRANYVDKEPVLFIHPTYWRKKYTGTRQPVVIDSNCDEIELFVKGTSLGRIVSKRDNYNSVCFDSILVQDAEISAVGYINNKKVITRKLSMPGSPDHIVLQSTHTKLDGQNEGIAVLTAYVVDKNNHLVFDASPDIKWTVSGEAKLIGPSAYTSDIHKLESKQGIGYETVPVCNVIRGTEKTGKIKITVSSPGLKTGSLTLKNVPEVISSVYLKQPKPIQEGRQDVERDIHFTEDISYTDLVKTRLSANTRFPYTNRQQLLDSLSNFLDHKEGGKSLHGYGYATLLSQLSEVIIRMKGLLIGDDFNFIMQQYNLYLNLERVIENRMFHVLYTDLLKKEYLEKIMIDRIPIDYVISCKDIESLPAKIKVCYINYDPAVSTNKLIYDYASQTYSFTTNTLKFNADLMKAIEAKGTSVEWGKEVARLSKGVLFNESEQTFKFENVDMMLIIPAE